MTATIEIPDELAEFFAPSGQDLSCVAIEAIALEGYRSGRLTTGQVRRLLGFETRMQVHEFLKTHGVYLNYSAADLEHDLEMARETARELDKERIKKVTRERRAG
jgi:predicted HTH domain antitoxin